VLQLSLTISSTKRLNDGTKMPLLGLGTWQVPQGRAGIETVKCALKVGYRLVDTATLYRNEREVGEAVRESGVPREQVFVTTKLWNSDHGYERALRACDRSLELLGLEYIDLYLIHWPVTALRKETWDALVALRKEGKCRSIGVSNYTIRHLQELMSSSSVLPSVNQVEFNPFLYQKELLEFCRSKNIALEAYRPLTQGSRLGHPVLNEIARGYSRTPAQILIRWSIQHDLIVIPKSVKPERIIENSRVFDFAISSGDMKRLDALNENLRTDWDPTNQP
jgi:diketogulonate reductase-like aldo/keto reductase